jgi:hypothetical protein
MMSEIAFEDVRSCLKTVPDLRQGKGATEADLRELVSVWGPLPVDFKQYLQEFGWLAFGAYELYGLGPDVPSHLNVVDRSRELWNGDGNYKLPSALLPLYEGGGWFYCLSRLHHGQPVVCWSQEYDDLGEGQPYDETYSSWSRWIVDYVLGSITQQSGRF